MFASPRADSMLGTLSITAQVWSQYAGMLPTSQLSLLYVEPTAQPLYMPSVLFGLGLMLSTAALPLALEKSRSWHWVLLDWLRPIARQSNQPH